LKLRFELYDRPIPKLFLLFQEPAISVRAAWAPRESRWVDVGLPEESLSLARLWQAPWAQGQAQQRLPIS